MEQQQPKPPKSSRRKKLIIWLLVDVAVAAIVLALLLYKPAQYHPIRSTAADPNGQRVPPYLHRELGSELYNGAQKQRPFEIVVLNTNLNEALAEMRWSQQAGGITLSAPAVLFTPGHIVLMGTARVEGAEFVVTIELGPRLDEQGYLNLLVTKVKIGAVNVTPLAKMVARKMYQQRLETGPVDTRDLGAKIAASLLTEEPFKPVFKLEDKWVRLQDFDLTEGQLIARFAPAE